MHDSIRQFKRLTSFVVGLAVLATSVLTSLPAQAVSDLSTVQAPAPAPMTQAAACDANDLGGQVWRDINANGQQDNTADFTEPGFYDAGITVVAYDENNGQIAATTLASDGSYVFDNLFAAPNANRPVRIEFQGLPDYMEEGASGPQNGTSVQFYAASSCSADWGVNYPSDYCQENPDMAVTCFRNGQAQNRNGPVGTLYTFPYDSMGRIGVTDPNQNANYMPNLVAEKLNTGAVWGLAYNREEKVLYTSAFVKRHAGLSTLQTGGVGSNPLGAIFQTDPYTPVDDTGLFINLAQQNNPTTGNLIYVGDFLRDYDTDADLTNDRQVGWWYDTSRDAWAYPLVGRAGLGDIDISDDMSKLYAVNLADRNVYVIDIATKTVEDNYNLNGIATCGGGSNQNLWHPFALKYYQGKLYMGGVCDAPEGTPHPSSPGSARVYTWNAGTRAWDNVLAFDLMYPREPAFTYCLGKTGWYNWLFSTTSFPASCNNGEMVHPTAILSDIEFDDNGNMILGLMDRTGHQWGWANVAPDGSIDPTDGNRFTGRSGYSVLSGGDILRATPVGDGTFIHSPITILSTVTYGTPPNTQSEDVTSEFFTGDESSGRRENSMGSLAVLAGKNEVAMTTSHPIQGASGGIRWLNTTTGETAQISGVNHNYEIYSSYDAFYVADDPNTPENEASIGWGDFGKGNGLGDLELLCDSAPIDVGNRIWIDTDGDGIQDAGESGVEGVTVRLYSGTPGSGTFVGDMTTGADGEYYFKNLDPKSDYYIEIDDTSGGLSDYELTRQNYRNDAPDTDDEDSDAAYNAMTGSVIIPFTTGAAGENDYTLDAGFKPLLGAIGNFVWLDENSDGYQDEGEPGLPNVAVVLYGDPDGDGTVQEVARTLTDSHGGYLFDQLPLGDYYVDVWDGTGGTIYTMPYGDGNAATPDDGDMTQTPPSTLPNADFGNQDHGATLIPNNPGLTGYPVTIGNGQPLENLTADFGYNVNNDTDVNGNNNNAALGDRVWIDANGDGKQDPNEVGVGGAEVTLYGPGSDGVFGTGDDAPYTTNGYDSTRMTDENGYYMFDNLPPGAYEVRVTDSSGASHPIPIYTDGQAANGYTQTGDPDHFAQKDNSAGANDGRTTNPVVLGPGDVFLNADFGYQPAGAVLNSVGDTIFFDADMDGNGPSLSAVDPDDTTPVTQGAGSAADMTDYGIPGVTVALIEDSNDNGIWDAGEPIIATDTTDANGQYLFEGLPDGKYLVWVNDTDNVLDGLNQSYDSDGVLGSPDMSAVDLDSSGVNSSPVDDRLQDFGYGPSTSIGTIGDTVWYDVDGSGGNQTTQGAEPGIPGVTVNLYQDRDGNGLPDDINGDGSVDNNDALATTRTDSNGNYLFENLPMGGYVVEVDESTLPAGFNPMPTYEPDGDSDGYGQPVSLTSDAPANLQQDFSYTKSGLNSVGDYVWGDVNSSGGATAQAGEPGLAGVTVNLYDSSSNLLASTTTDDNGYYLFDSLPDGTYTVKVDTRTLPSGWSAASTYDGPDGGNDSTSTVSLSGGQHNRTQDFSYPPNADTNLRTYSIGDTVWFDADDSGGDQGTQGNEPGLANVRIDLLDNGGNVIDSTYTDSNGNYLFDELPAGTYTVRVDTTTLPNYASPVSTFEKDGANTGSETTVTIGAGAPDGAHPRDVDFSYPPTMGLGAIGDTVWFDADGSGGSQTTQGDESGIEGVAMELYADLDGDGQVDDLLATAMTDENGHYYFGDLPLNEDYKVVVASKNFASGGVLEGLSETYAAGNTLGGNEGNTVTLTDANPINLDQDFSYHAPVEPMGMIGDTIWYDANSNKTQDDGEEGIPGVIVQLKDADNGNVIATAVTDENGHYLFPGLDPAEDYQVVVAPENFNPGGALEGLKPTNDPDNDSNNNESSVNLANDSDGIDLDQDFGYVTTLNSVGDTVFYDVNSNSQQDADEPGLPGVVVELYTNGSDGLPNTADDVLVDTTTTDATGYYLFDDLPDDTYTVKVNTSTLPSYVETTPTDDPEGNMDSLSTVTLAGGIHDDIRDFGYPPSATSQNIGVIGDTIWEDKDGDGIQDSDEKGIPGVKVILTYPDGTTTETVTTDENGNYLFDGLPVDGGDYIVTVDPTTLPSNLSTTPSGYPTGGDDNNSSVTLTSADPVNLDQDWGYPPKNPGMIGDTIWFDVDGNGFQDANEPGLGGVEVTLTYSGGTMTTVTDSNGNYLFEDLPLGVVYTVTVNPDTLPSYVDTTPTGYPSGGADNNSTLQLTTGAPVNLMQDWGYPPSETQTGAIGNLVWLDQNADGVNDGPNGPDGIAGTDDDELGIEGVTLDLYRDTNGNGKIDPGEPKIGTTTTDAGGGYLFDGLPAGDYVVDVTDEAGLLNGYWHSLGDEGVDNNSQTDPYAVTIGGTEPWVDLTADFGYYVEPASLGNYVWIDANENGLQDDGETGLNGVIVTLTIDYPNGIQTVLKTLTKNDAGGNAGWYSFNNLLQDEDYNGDGAGPEPTFTISVDSSQAIFTNDEYKETRSDVGGNDWMDSDPFSGVSAYPVQGLTDVEAQDPATSEQAIASYDFGVYLEIKLAVALNYAYSERAADGTVYFIWETATETGNAGFNLYMELADGSEQSANGELVPSSVIDSVAPTRYTYQANVAGERYTIEFVNVDGSTERYGPFQIGVEYGDPAAANPSTLTNPLYLPFIEGRQ
ncbi:MAG: carboxypeptidase regulatory-like domain-containing protein [Caldilineaceae bacterium]|nr:carboxypeptidase regulatory-like domain-containing protein [Caldilineaceae bacterium]